MLQGWTRLTLTHHKTLSFWRKRTCFYFHVYTCLTGKVQTSTSSPEVSRPHSFSVARIFSSFQLLSIVLIGLPNLHRGTIKRKERKRQEVLWPETHAKIATVNIHTKIALPELPKVDQLSSLVVPRFWYRSYHKVGLGGRICLILGGNN